MPNPMKPVTTPGAPTSSKPATTQPQSADVPVQEAATKPATTTGAMSERVEPKDGAKSVSVGVEQSNDKGKDKDRPLEVAAGREV